MNITVIGTGYVGLVTGTCFAETGNHVTCVDIDESKVQKMQAGIVPIYEPGLEILFERNTRQGRLTFTTQYRQAVEDAQIIFLALPTPPGGDGHADLTYILKAAEDLSHYLKGYTIIVDKSTVPVGTAESVHQVIAQNADESLFDVVSNPEFLREGVAINDFLKPDRVVIGTRSEKAKNVLKQLYLPFVRQGNPIYFMDERSAEMTKYASNSYLATRISFMNEIANLCEKLGANVDHVRKGMGSDTRIGKRFLFPGVGYGGSCFPKDVQALSKTAEKYDYEFKILQAVMKTNTIQKTILGKKIKNYFKGELTNKKIAIWGLAFKPNTDDIREAPSLELIRFLLDEGANVRVFDPEAIQNTKSVFGNEIFYAENLYDTLDDADALAIVTEWSEFRTPDFDLMKERMRHPAIFDGRNLYDIDYMTTTGFYYNSIGR